MALTEPGGGSDLQNISTTAVPSGSGGSDLVVNGSKTWISNARRSGLIALLCKTDPAANPRHAGISVLLVEPGPGLTVSRDLPKLGYKRESRRASCRSTATACRTRRFSAATPAEASRR